MHLNEYTVGQRVSAYVRGKWQPATINRVSRVAPHGIHWLDVVLASGAVAYGVDVDHVRPLIGEDQGTHG